MVVAFFTPSRPRTPADTIQRTTRHYQTHMPAMNNHYPSSIQPSLIRAARRNVRALSSLLLLAASIPAWAQQFSLSRSEASGKYGVQDDKGQMIIPQQYASIGILADGNFLVYEEDPGWPMVINSKKEVLVSKTNYIYRVLDAFDGHFLCQYYKDGRPAELVLIKAGDKVLHTFAPAYIHGEFIKDPCFTWVKAQTVTPGELLAVDLMGNALTGPGNPHFDYIRDTFKPCNNYVIVMKGGADGTSSGVYDLGSKKMIIPCSFDHIEYDAANQLIKTYHKQYTQTYDLYNMQGVLHQRWEQIKK